MDVNIHYRLLKAAWSASFGRWDVPSLLQTVPPLFGLWHGYKYVVIQVARQFHSAVWYLIRGTLRVGDHTPTSPTLRTYELLFAALLQVPQTLKDDLAVMHDRWCSLRDHDRNVMQLVGVSTLYSQETGVMLGVKA